MGDESVLTVQKCIPEIHLEAQCYSKIEDAHDTQKSKKDRRREKKQKKKEKKRARRERRKRRGYRRKAGRSDGELSSSMLDTIGIGPIPEDSALETDTSYSQYGDGVSTDNSDSSAERRRRRRQTSRRRRRSKERR